MSLRLKIVLALVLLATCATAAVGVSSYVSTRHELNEVIDRSLKDAAANPGSLLRFFFGRGPGLGPGRGGFNPDADGDGDGPIEAPPASSTRWLPRSSAPMEALCDRRHQVHCRSETPIAPWPTPRTPASANRAT